MKEELKLLYFVHDFQHHVVKNFYYLSKGLEDVCDCKVWHKPANIHEVMKELDFQPDFILINDVSGSPSITGLEEVDIPIGLLIHDAHRNVIKRNIFIEQYDIQFLFTIYRDEFLKRHPQYKKRMFWLPHFVNTNIFKDYQYPKEINWLLMGRITNHYPTRQRIYKRMRNKNGFVYYSHPGYKNVNELDRGIFVGEKYAKEINRAKMFITDDSKLHLPFMKYYEVLACNTLLLAPANKELLDLGFKPKENFVEINKYNFEQVANYYLIHEEERKKIAQAGYEMVHERHSLEVRVKELIDMIKSIVKKSDPLD